VTFGEVSVYYHSAFYIFIQLDRTMLGSIPILYSS